MELPILCADPRRQYFAHRDEIDQAVSRVLSSESYILGGEVRLFEEEFARYINANHCISLNSGTDALLLSLRALGIGRGHEVITPSHTAVATVSAIVTCGATPVFVDIDPVSFTVNPNLVDEAVTRHTRAIIAVHLYGHPCDMDSLQEIATRRGIILVEDCAQAHGAEWHGKKVGTFGSVGCFSFYPTKNLGAIGDGGAVVTNDPTIAERIRSLRQYGWDSNRLSLEPSSVSRLDEVQAAILRVKLRFLEQKNNRRRELAQKYSLGLEDCDLTTPVSVGKCSHVYHLFVVRIPNRELVIRRLNEKEIFPGIHYQSPVHMQPAYSKLPSSHSGMLTVTEGISRTILSLPMFPELEDSEIERVCEEIKSV